MMLDKINKMVNRYKEIDQKLTDPNIGKDVNKYKELMQEHSHLREIVECFEKYEETETQIEDAKKLVAAGPQI